MGSDRRKFLTGGAAAAGGAAIAGFPMIAKAQQTFNWKMTSAYAKGAPFYMDGPGSATDLAARVIGQQLQTALGKPFVVENKPGAQGTIAGSEVVRAAPDGQTLLFTSNTAIASNVPLMKKMPYDPTKDFTPVAGVGTTALVLMVKPDFPAKNLKEFVALQKTFADSPKSWSVDLNDIDPQTFDLSVKNPNGGEDVTHRSPEEILSEIAALDAESAEVLQTIRGLL
jgi:tripartite-type tricarboxylate transporter receptor subunit TctC